VRGINLAPLLSTKVAAISKVIRPVTCPNHRASASGPWAAALAWSAFKLPQDLLIALPISFATSLLLRVDR
jgi:hypothetical protein